MIVNYTNNSDMMYPTQHKSTLIHINMCAFVLTMYCFEVCECRCDRATLVHYHCIKCCVAATPLAIAIHVCWKWSMMWNVLQWHADTTQHHITWQQQHTCRTTLHVNNVHASHDTNHNWVRDNHTQHQQHQRAACCAAVYMIGAWVAQFLITSDTIHHTLFNPIKS